MLIISTNSSNFGFVGTRIIISEYEVQISNWLKRFLSLKLDIERVSHTLRKPSSQINAHGEDLLLKVSPSRLDAVPLYFRIGIRDEACYIAFQQYLAVMHD